MQIYTRQKGTRIHQPTPSEKTPVPKIHLSHHRFCPPTQLATPSTTLNTSLHHSAFILLITRFADPIHLSTSRIVDQLAAKIERFVGLELIEPENLQ